MFTQLFDLVNNTVTSNIGSMVGVFISLIIPFLGACIGLYIVILAYKALYDSENLMIMESINFIFKLALVTSIALSTEYYSGNVVPIVMNIGDNIAVELLGGNSSVGSLQTMFDSFLNDINIITNRMNFSVFDPDTYGAAFILLLMVIILIIGVLPFLLVSTAYLLIAKIMVGFLLIIGPLYIMLSIFPSTRSLFQAWTGQCFNYILLSIIFPIAFAMFGMFVDALVFSQPITIGSIFMASIVFFSLLLISVQIPTFTSSLSGGVGINGLVGGVGQTLRAITGAGSNAGSGVKNMTNSLKNLSPGKNKILAG